MKWLNVGKAYGTSIVFYAALYFAIFHLKTGTSHFAALTFGTSHVTSVISFVMLFFEKCRKTSKLSREKVLRRIGIHMYV